MSFDQSSHENDLRAFYLYSNFKLKYLNTVSFLWVKWVYKTQGNWRNSLSKNSNFKYLEIIRNCASLNHWKKFHFFSSHWISSAPRFFICRASIMTTTIYLQQRYKLYPKCIALYIFAAFSLDYNVYLFSNTFNIF